MTSLYPPAIDPDIAFGIRTASPWSGADNTNHFFTTQDLWDPLKVGIGAGGGGDTFVDRMKRAQNSSPSSYDRYTYYRMLSQLGTDSAPEPETKLNLNYINIGGLKSTNFVAWNDPDLVNGNPARGIPRFNRPGSEIFFSNAVDRLVRRYTEDWRELNLKTHSNLLTYSNTFGTVHSFGASRIPVFVNGRFVYSPSLHRQLQLAANTWDALHGTNDIYGPLPTVFQPLFTNELGNIFINDFREITEATQLSGALRDLSSTTVVASVQWDDLLFGVPLIIGARKGLPNFNEFTSEVVVQITRKAEVRRPSPGAKINLTNQMFVIGISNGIGAEFWNSYTNIYRRPVEVLVTNYTLLALTNDFTFTHRSNIVVGAATNLTAWAAWQPKRHDPPASGPWSFIVPLRTNQVILPDSAYRHNSASFDRVTTTFETTAPQMWFPRWGLTITNRFVAIIKEPGPKGRIIDYVQLVARPTHQELTLGIIEQDQKRPLSQGRGLWNTNSPDGVRLSGYPGIRMQIEDVSMGQGGFDAIWENNSINQQSGATKYQAIANFRFFMGHTSPWTGGDGRRYQGTNSGSATVATVPFSPTMKWSLPVILQANDPLVHYTVGDLEDLEKSEVAVPWTPPSNIQKSLENLGKLNRRFQPWGGNPNGATDDPLAYQTAVKDPGVARSDDWQFPTNMLPTLGWLGRIHRGTPWQTVYLKSTRVTDDRGLTAAWTNWTGNRLVWTDVFGRQPLSDSLLTQPEMDRSSLDLFTTAPNDNAARGQLPINQTGLAAWSAVFGGMIALTNSVADDDLGAGAALTGYSPLPIEPAGVYDAADAATWGPVRRIVEAINLTRADTNLFPTRTFRRLGDLLATRELTEASPFLNLASEEQRRQGVNDVAYEWLPQQMLSLVRLGEPRFVIYSYGQALKPADRSVQVSGTYRGMATNYQITAEVATRAVVRVEGSPDPRYTNDTAFPFPDARGRWLRDPNTGQFYPPRIVVESFNVLPPD